MSEVKNFRGAEANKHDNDAARRILLENIRALDAMTVAYEYELWRSENQIQAISLVEEVET